MAANTLACFKAYDIRGQVPHDLTPELVRHIGLAYAAEIQPRTVCIGYDMRLTSRDFAHILASALQDGGVDVTDIGLCGTEEIYFATFSQGFDGGIMITASHNPHDWNGMKLVGKDATPIHSGNGLQKMQERILSGDLPVARKRGSYESASYRKEYVKHLMTYLAPETPSSLAPLRIVANAGNGCAWLPMVELIDQLPCTVIPMYEQPDGRFPHGVPNPLLPENRAATQKAVRIHGADMGIAWDGDFDRCFFFDEQGNFIEGYYIVGLLAEALLTEQPGARILHDPRLVWNTQDIVAHKQGIAIESKTGHAFIKERMRQENALYGGEMSAHHYFRNFAFCDSGMIVWLLVYKLLSQKKLPLSQLVQERMRAYPVSGEINSTVADPEAAIARVVARYGEQAESISYTDGVSIAYPQWRCNIRCSNTEPLLRLNVETRGNVALLQEMTDILLGLLTMS